MAAWQPVSGATGYNVYCDGVQLDSMLIKALNVEAVNAFAQQAIYPNNQVIVITAPEKEGVENPTTEEILAIRDKVAAAEIEAYEDNTVKEPLIPEGTTLEGSPVKKTAQNAEYGTTEWTLANGVKVIVKPTTYKADEVRMSALAKGGLSILSDEEFAKKWHGPARVLCVVHFGHLRDFADPAAGLSIPHVLARSPNGKFLLVSNRP